MAFGWTAILWMYSELEKVEFRCLSLARHLQHSSGLCGMHDCMEFHPLCLCKMSYASLQSLQQSQRLTKPIKDNGRKHNCYIR